MRKLLKALLVFSIGLIVLSGCVLSTGCARVIDLHPILGEDIALEGDKICFTPDYVQEIMKARLGE